MYVSWLQLVCVAELSTTQVYVGGRVGVQFLRNVLLIYVVIFIEILE